MVRYSHGLNDVINKNVAEFNSQVAFLRNIDY